MYTSIRLVDASEKNQTEVSDEEYLEMLRMLKGNDED
jgi:hypothetical protein